MTMLNLKKQAEEIGIQKSKLLSLYQLYASQTETDIQKLEEAIGRENRKGVRQMAHHIKGASLNLELDDLSRCSQEIIDLCDSRSDWGGIQEKARSLSIFLRDMNMQLERESSNE